MQFQVLTLTTYFSRGTDALELLPSKPNDMALDSNLRHPPIITDTQDCLSFNPFAEPQESPSPVAVAHSYRAVSRDALFRRHVHPRTEPYSRGDDNGWHLHPLRSAGLANGSSEGDAGITRPHLSRIVKVGTLVDAPCIQSDDISDTSSLSVEEKDVLVHEVCHDFVIYLK